MIILALVFDFMNGFHAAANFVATIVSTGAMRPQWVDFSQTQARHVNKKARPLGSGCFIWCLAVTYFRMRAAHYHRR